MKNELFLRELHSANIDVHRHVPMSKYTTFKAGGCADLLVSPKNQDELIQVLELTNDYIIIGNGSNILVTDDGIKTPVILTTSLSLVEIRGNEVFAQSGAKLTAMCSAALSAGLTGLEFASGIPGTIGGGVYMNAGAYDGELCQFIKSVHVWEDGRIKQFSCEEMCFSYRKSIAMEKKLVILGAEFALERGDVSASIAKTKALNAQRRQKQPLEYPSAGSTFKRPPGKYAGELIEKAGLKGERIGDAMVSEKHAGFIVNVGAATASDIIALIKRVQTRVFEHSGIMVEPEVKIIGDGAKI